MRNLISLIACMLTVFFLQAQSDSIEPAKHQTTFNAMVWTYENKIKTGRLYAVNDSQVVLIKPRKAVSGSESGYAQVMIPVERIEKLTLQRKNSALKGGLIGLGIGIFTGLVIGFASGDDDPEGWFAMTAEEKALVGAVGLGATGAITGLVIGALAKKKFIIGGKRETYRDLQGELMSRLVQK